ncbi:MAG: hypothetical protein AAB225_13485 [Acidobacteriota bacterium]
MAKSMALALVLAAVLAGQFEWERLPEGPGLAAKYPGDAGIEGDPAVVFAENFESGEIADLRQRWHNVSDQGGKVLAGSDSVPEASSGRRSLSMTATRGENQGGHLYRVLAPGHDRLFLRFYVKFAADNGFNHHFVSLGGEIDPPPYPVGRAGLRPVDTWNSGIEPAAASYQTVPSRGFPPPGIWHFYTYWPEMRSWQNADGTGTSFYGNDFEPKEPAAVPRDAWVCVEVMVKMNSSPDSSDGEQAFWIDGKRVARFAPGSVRGTWVRDVFRIDEENGQPFEGLRWRRDMRVKVNKLWLSHYVSETAFERNDGYAGRHPDFEINTRSNTVFFDDVVVSTEYVGPIEK